VNWLGEAPAVGSRVAVQVRHRAPAAAAEIIRLTANEVELALDEPVAAITPGQSVVVYDEARVLGGGIIETAKRSRPQLPILAA
jgi:tRNA-specific 2-thiouridylase